MGGAVAGACDVIQNCGQDCHHLGFHGKLEMGIFDARHEEYDTILL